MTTPTSAGNTNSTAGTAMLKWSRKGSITARRAAKPISVTTTPSTVRWYVALVTSPLRLTFVTSFRHSVRLPSVPTH